MAIRSFKTVGSDSDEINRIQDYMDEALRPLQACPLTDGVLLTKISLIAGQPNVVEHKLGKKITGWIVVDKDAAATIHRGVVKYADKTLTLHTNTNCIVSLWCF